MKPSVNVRETVFGFVSDSYTVDKLFMRSLLALCSFLFFDF